MHLAKHETNERAEEHLPVCVRAKGPAPVDVREELAELRDKRPSSEQNSDEDHRPIAMSWRGAERYLLRSLMRLAVAETIFSRASRYVEELKQ